MDRCSCRTTTTASSTASRTASEIGNEGRGGFDRRVFIYARGGAGRRRGRREEGRALRGVPRRGRQFRQPAVALARAAAGAVHLDGSFHVPRGQPEERS